MATLIFANGHIETYEWLRPYLEQAGQTIIAANGGTRHLRALGRRPDVLIGDLDSLEGPEDEAAGEVVRHPAVKDATDLELALLYAAASCPEPILVFGMLGGRLDHLLANILLLANPRLQEREVVLVEPDASAWVVSRRLELNGRVGDVVSLIPLDDRVLVRRTRGLRWALADARLQFGTTRGVSNEMVAATAVVEVAAGRLLCVHQRVGPAVKAMK